MKARSLRVSLIPAADSTPDDTSTPSGRVARIRFGHVVGIEAARNQEWPPGALGHDRPRCSFSATAIALGIGVVEEEAGFPAQRLLERRLVSNTDGTDDLFRPQPVPGRRNLVAVQLCAVKFQFVHRFTDHQGCALTNTPTAAPPWEWPRRSRVPGRPARNASTHARNSGRSDQHRPRRPVARPRTRDAADLDQETHGRPRSLRNAEPGSGSHIKPSPTRTASMPPPASCACRLRLRMPDSATSRRCDGINGRMLLAKLMSIRKCEGPRWLTPTRRASAASARSTSARSWVSTSASMPRRLTSVSSPTRSSWVERTR